MEAKLKDAKLGNKAKESERSDGGIAQTVEQSGDLLVLRNGAEKLGKRNINRTILFR